MIRRPAASWSFSSIPKSKPSEFQTDPYHPQGFGQHGESRDIISGAIRDERFVVHAFPFTFETEASDPESLARGLKFSAEIARDHGLELPRDAKLTDVPSHSWFIPTLMKHAGIDFLHIGCNPASPSPDVPFLFWWEGPDGSRVMTMYWEPYYGTDIIPPEGYPLSQKFDELDIPRTLPILL